MKKSKNKPLFFFDPYESQKGFEMAFNKISNALEKLFNSVPKPKGLIEKPDLPKKDILGFKLELADLIEKYNVEVLIIGGAMIVDSHVIACDELKISELRK